MLRYARGAAAIALVLGATTGVAAQGLEVEVTPMVGGQLFLGDLPGAFTLDSEAGSQVTFDGAEIEDALAVGGRLGLRHGHNLGLGATVVYSPTTLTEASGAETDLGVWVYGVDATYFAPSPHSIAQPFVLAGIGGKTYDVDGMDPENDLMWNVGAGLDLQFHPLHVPVRPGGGRGRRRAAARPRADRGVPLHLRARGAVTQVVRRVDRRKGGDRG